MKKILIVFVLALLPVIGSAQSVFDKFEDNDEISTFVVNKYAFKLMSKFGSEEPEAKEYFEMINNLSELKVFITENPTIAAEMNATATKYIKSSKLIELMRIKDKGSNVKIYVKEGVDEDHVKELFMFVSDGEGGKPQSVILSLTGNIDLNKISELTEKMNIPGGEHLKKANKSK